MPKPFYSLVTFKNSPLYFILVYQCLCISRLCGAIQIYYDYDYDYDYYYYYQYY